VAAKYLTGLIALIKTNLGNMESGEPTSGSDTNVTEKAEQVHAFYNNTIKHIKHKKKLNPSSAYADIEL